MIYSKLKIFDWKRLHGYKPVPVYESMHLVYSSEIKLFTCCIVGHKSKKSAASQSFAVIFLKILMKVLTSDMVHVPVHGLG